MLSSTHTRAPHPQVNDGVFHRRKSSHRAAVVEVRFHQPLSPLPPLPPLAPPYPIICTYKCTQSEEDVDTLESVEMTLPPQAVVADAQAVVADAQVFSRSPLSASAHLPIIPSAHYAGISLSAH